MPVLRAPHAFQAEKQKVRLLQSNKQNVLSCPLLSSMHGFYCIQLYLFSNIYLSKIEGGVLPHITNKHSLM